MEKNKKHYLIKAIEKPTSLCLILANSPKVLASKLNAQITQTLKGDKSFIIAIPIKLFTTTPCGIFKYSQEQLEIVASHEDIRYFKGEKVIVFLVGEITCHSF